MISSLKLIKNQNSIPYKCLINKTVLKNIFSTGTAPLLIILYTVGFFLSCIYSIHGFTVKINKIIQLTINKLN
jgi:hypothetical protein